MPGPRYPNYVLGVLVVVYVFNFLDRQILSILAERIRADLGISDAQLGFLYGTAFAVFYALFGIPLGRLADVWDRRRLIALGLAAWSTMTALSGFTRSFAQLAAARIGVGIGEASAAPAAFSLLSDYFPPARRATVLAIYSSGIYIGAGLGLGIGGFIVDRWDLAFAGGPTPFGLRGWQVAFMAVGTPGLLLALWVASLREPPRERHPHPFREFFREVMSVVPPLTLVHLSRAGSVAEIVRNLALMLATAALAALLTYGLGTPAQWIALGIGIYAAGSWMQALRLRDREAFEVLTQTPALAWAAAGFSLCAFTGYANGFWVPSYFMRTYGLDAGTAGLTLGGISAAGGWLGTTCGGLLADRWATTSPAGRVRVGLLCGVVAPIMALALLFTPSATLALVLFFPVVATQSLWIGPGASTVQDIVPPRMRGTASAAYLMVVTFVGLALGPYVVGRVSVATGDLRVAMLVGLLGDACGAFCLWRSARWLSSRSPRSTDSR